ncbi:hypothetical protein [Paraburkholderia sp. HP33-1]|uniref:hypothetical protein n=1 Tax=Paraburkholderia sp. HP33-1 TaxID=2883243 RepID=UPI001F215647|nr:hypothetical protein [Paraburkholderia sp. HP33-1]
MRTALFVAGGLICVCTSYAYAQNTTANPTTVAQPVAQPDAMSSEGPDPSGTSMSGAREMTSGKTRAEVYQDLVRSQQNGEAARMQELYKGGN